MRQDRYQPSSSPRRRKSPPHDARSPDPPATSSGIQIRGLARDREEQALQHDGRADRRVMDYDDRHDDGKDSWRPRTRDDSDQRARPRRVSPTPPRSPRRRYRDRDAPEYHSPEPDVHNKSSSPRRGDRSPGPPSREIIMEGLPEHMGEDDIKSELKAYRVESLDDVRVIRDRRTGKSRQFGFLKFWSIEDSKAFLERNFPTIHLYGPALSGSNSKATPVGIAFCRPRPEREQTSTEGDWLCGNCSMYNYSFRVDCLRCKADKADVAEQPRPPPAANIGDSDVSPDSTPSQYLLLRSLEPSVTEELLAKGAAKLLKTEDSAVPNDGNNNKTAPTSTAASAGARPGCIRRVLLVRNRRTNESCKYGFVEFATVEDAQAALAKFNSLDKFTIASKPVIASYIHAGVFVPHLHPAASRFTFPASTNPSLQLDYWDDSAYCSALIISTDEDAAEKKSSASKPKDDASTTKPKKRKADANNPSDPAKPKKQMATHLQFWTNRHAELHGVALDQSPTASDQAKEAPQAQSPEKPTPTPAPAPNTPKAQSYADPSKHCCYLCTRQFKSAPEVEKHERLSDLHAKNLLDTGAVAKAVARLSKAGIPLLATATASEEAADDDDDEGAAYRDRAQERRKAYAQPKQPGFKMALASSTSISASGGGAAKAQAQASAAAPAKARVDSDVESEAPPKQSKGASLLAKMGHVPGQGLGAGRGVQAPIETNIYAAGVGLGAEGGKLGDAVEQGAKATRGDYGEFVKDVRQRARERYEKEG